ncbi:MAG: cobS [Clostridia bacterium]|jgi:adenosylcobinamide-GDP ribazoletransferase|nr:cobS [Clostridia bacterium]
MKRFIGILQFLTRIPLRADFGVDDGFYKSIVYFPLVGAVLGMLYYITGYLSLLVFDHLITALMILFASVLLTGGLHIDGVGDTFDGLYSYRDKAKILEIMKDSRLGTNGLLAIFFLLLFKTAFIYSLLQQNSLWAIFIMPVFGRLNSSWACYKTITPREKGMGNIFIGKTSLKMMVIEVSYTMAIVFGIVYLLSPTPTVLFLSHLLLLIGILIAVRLFIRSVYKKIDGITGDILGAVCEIAELLYLAGAYFMVQH